MPQVRNHWILEQVLNDRSRRAKAQENEAAQEEILWLRDEISLLKKNTDADETSSTSALSDDPQDCEESDDKHNLISKDTFEVCFYFFDYLVTF